MERPFMLFEVLIGESCHLRGVVIRIGENCSCCLEAWELWLKFVFYSSVVAFGFKPLDYVSGSCETTWCQNWPRSRLGGHWAGYWWWKKKKRLNKITPVVNCNVLDLKIVPRIKQIGDKRLVKNWILFWCKLGILCVQLHRLIPRVLWDSNGWQTH
jgi:hypothetical protein